MMESALAKWKSLPGDQRILPGLPHTGEKVAWQKLYPSDGLVLSVTSRDLERNPPVENNWRGKSWNRDYAWFTSDETASFIPAELKVGERRDVPTDLVNRLYRLHLVDNVRGETLPYPVNGIEKGRLTATVTALDADTIKLHLEGEARLSNEGVWSIAGFRDMETPTPQKRGFEPKLLGRATYDRKKQRFAAFEMLAVGMRWGATQYNGRTRDPGPAPMAVAFTLAGNSAAERVPPAYLYAYGWK